MLTIKNLEKCFYTASQNDFKYVGVLIQMPGSKKPEIILNENPNFDYKFDYYKNTYNEQLDHKHAPGIKIIGFTYGNSLSEIEIQLLRPQSDFGIDIAKQYLKRGSKIARKNWNGKDMYLQLQIPDIHSKMTLPYVYMKTNDDNYVPWIASQTDLLAEDYYLIKGE